MVWRRLLVARDEKGAAAGLDPPPDPPKKTRPSARSLTCRENSDATEVDMKQITTKVTDWDSISPQEFWQVADELQERTLEHAEDLFAYVEEAEPEQLISILTQYRFFTIYYIPDLAILIARLKDGRLRTFLADILSDELGYGDASQAHPRLYDDFLETLGVKDRDLDGLAIKENVDLLDHARGDLMDPSKSSTYGVGLRGMGGECVCQIYLARLYEHVIKNPYIEENKPSIDWKFWELHVGEHDIEHRLKTRQLINEEVVAKGSKRIGDLGRGYFDSMVSWSSFWNNIFASVRSPRVERSRVQAEASFPALSSAAAN